MNELTNHKFTKYGYDEFELSDENGETLHIRRELFKDKIFAWEELVDQNWISIESLDEINELEELFQTWKNEKE